MAHPVRANSNKREYFITALNIEVKYVGLNVLMATLSDRNVTRTEPIYTWVSIPPGKYRISVYPLNYDWHGEAAARSTLDIEAGKNYFIKVDWPPKPEPSFVAAMAQPLIEPIVGRKPYAAPELIVLPEVEGFEAIRNCRFVESTE